MKKICVIGNYSGRNAGDAAILGGLLEDVSALYPECKYLVPTINTGFVQENYSKYNIRPVGLMPWNLSIKIFGLPILLSVFSSDLVLVTDAILFDYKLLNPLYNYLFTLSLVLPLAKKRGIPIVLYNVSLGPVYSVYGKKCLNRIIDCSDKILLRDRESLSLLKTLQPHFPGNRIHETADCALNTIPGSYERLSKIKKKEKILLGTKPWISFNISSYLDVYVRGYKKGGIGRENFTNIIAEVIDKFINRTKVNVLLVATQHMDMTIIRELYSKLSNKENVKIISNREYSYKDLALVFSNVEMHVGMRTHSLILASSVFTPVIGIIATPKNRGYMCSISQDRRMMEFKDLTINALLSLMESTWNERQRVKKELEVAVKKEKQKARQAAVYLKEFLV